MLRYTECFSIQCFRLFLIEFVLNAWSYFGQFGLNIAENEIGSKSINLPDTGFLEVTKHILGRFLCFDFIWRKVDKFNELRLKIGLLIWSKRQAYNNLCPTTSTPGTFIVQGRKRLACGHVLGLFIKVTRYSHVYPLSVFEPYSGVHGNYWPYTKPSLFLVRWTKCDTKFKIRKKNELLVIYKG